MDVYTSIEHLTPHTSHLSNSRNFEWSISIDWIPWDRAETLENVGPEANREKTTIKLKHINLDAILEPFWPHLGVLGRPLEAILGVLGAT